MIVAKGRGQKGGGKWKKKLGNLSRPPVGSWGEPGFELRESHTQ